MPGFLYGALGRIESIPNAFNTHTTCFRKVISMLLPGFEPGSSAPQADILSIELQEPKR